MMWSRMIAAVAVAALALGCGKVRDGDESTHGDGNGGDDGSGGDGPGDGGDGNGRGSGSGGRGSGSGGRNGTGATGAGASNPGSGASGSGSGGASSSGGASNSGGALVSGGTTNTGGTPNTGGAVAEEEGTKAMRAGPTVWIGQTETGVTYPGVVEEETAPEKMVLILDRVASGVTGTVTFGRNPSPPIPTDPEAPYPPTQSWTGPDGEWPTFDTNWTYSPYDGFSYTIVGSELRGNTLTLAFVPLELFSPWCDLQSGGPGGEVCQCADGECHGRDGPERRLELVVSGTTLSGQLSRPPGNWFGETPALKLERVK